MNTLVPIDQRIINVDHDGTRGTALVLIPQPIVRVKRDEHALFCLCLVAYKVSWKRCLRVFNDGHGRKRILRSVDTLDAVFIEENEHAWTVGAKDEIPGGRT